MVHRGPRTDGRISTDSPVVVGYWSNSSFLPSPSLARKAPFLVPLLYTYIYASLSPVAAHPSSFSRLPTAAREKNIPSLPVSFHRPVALLCSRAPRREVSQRASWWWLHRWLLASLQDSQLRECVPPRPRVKELPREQVHLLLLLPLPWRWYLLLLLLLLLSPSRPFFSSWHGLLLLPSSHLLPPYAPSGPYLRVLLIFSYYRWWACGHA